MYEVERDNRNDGQEECNLQMSFFLMERELREGDLMGVVPSQSEKKCGVKQRMGCGEGWKKWNLS